MARNVKKKILKLERKHVIAACCLMIAGGALLSVALALRTQGPAYAGLYDITCRNSRGTVISADKKVVNRYGISGYFISATANQCANRAQVQRVHKAGADTLVTLGSSLKASSASSLGSDGVFSRFKPDGVAGYDYVKNRTGAKVSRVFTYTGAATFSSGARACGAKNGVFNENYRNNNPSTITGVFTWWLFPTDAAYSSCDSPTNTYDLVVAYSASPIDANTVMISNAATYGMKVYLGLPKPQMDPKVGYVADASYVHTLGSFTTRMLATWNERFGANPAFAGVHQTLETPVFSNFTIWEPNLKVYRVLNDVVRYRLNKDKERVLFSPYASLDQQPASAIAPAYRAIVNTGGGVHVILAPQDGVGTGKVGISRVNTLYAEAKKAGAAEFWANVEAFKPGVDMHARAQTNKSTLDAQIAHANQYASKVISWHWNYMQSSDIARQLLGSGY